MSVVRIKICGITHPQDAGKAVELGAWALGFVFYKKSVRFVSAAKAREIIRALPPFVVSVGVFVNEKESRVKKIADFCGISTLQFHGDESPSYCGRFKSYKVIKAFRIKEGFDLSHGDPYEAVDAYLLDSYHPDRYGGTGRTFDLRMVRQKKINKPLIVSGGLNPQNIAQALREISPYAVDVSSGVERLPGRKDGRLLEEFFRNAQGKLDPPPKRGS